MDSDSTDSSCSLVAMQLRGQKLSAAGTARDKEVLHETENDLQPYLCMYYPWLPRCMHPQVNYAPPPMPPMYPMYNPTYRPVPHYAPIPAPYVPPQPTAPVPSMPTYHPPQPMPASTRLARRGGLDPPTSVKTHNGASWETMRIAGTDTKHIFALGDGFPARRWIRCTESHHPVQRWPHTRPAHYGETSRSRMQHQRDDRLFRCYCIVSDKLPLQS